MFFSNWKACLWETMPKSCVASKEGRLNGKQQGLTTDFHTIALPGGLQEDELGLLGLLYFVLIFPLSFYNTVL